MSLPNNVDNFHLNKNSASSYLVCTRKNVITEEKEYPHAITVVTSNVITDKHVNKGKDPCPENMKVI